jgi:hypothetical protein
MRYGTFMNQIEVYKNLCETNQISKILLKSSLGCLSIKYVRKFRETAKVMKHRSLGYVATRNAWLNEGMEHNHFKISFTVRTKSFMAVVMQNRK